MAKAIRHRRRGVLLQVRTHLEARDHERLCFLETCGLAADELESIDVTREPGLTWERIRSADLFFIGGSGEYSATRDYEFTPRLWEVVARMLDDGRPLFGSCWGHHFLARVAGAEVITDLARGELGTFDVELNDAGAGDPLFAGLPRRFAVHLGHHDRVTRLDGTGLVELGTTDICPRQILRLAGKPIYGTQFHSELNERHMRARLEMYQDRYLPDDLTIEMFEAMLRPTPVVADLLKRFVELYG